MKNKISSISRYIKDSYSILHALTDAIVIHNSESIEFINKEGIRLLAGSSHKDIINKQFINFIHKDDQKSYRIRWNLVNTKKKILKISDIRLVRCDSKEIHIDITFSPFSFENNHFVLITCIDITDRKRYENALKNNEQRFKSMVQNIDGYVYSSIYNAGNLLSVYHSPKCLQITGYTSEEYLKDSDLWIKMVYDTDREYIQDFFNKLNPEQLQNSVEHRIVHKDGSIRWISNTFTPQFNSRGRIIRLDGFIVDITERKEYEKALRHHNLFLQKLIDTIPNPVFYNDIEGKYRGTNKAFEEFIGLSSEMITGKTPFEIFPKKYASVLHKMDIKLLKKPVNQEFETQIINPDNSIHSIIVNKAIYKDADGNPGGFVGVLIDVTKLKQIQNELQETLEKLKEMEVIINCSPVVVFLWRAEEGWPVEFVSENVIQFGYSADEFISGGINYSDIIFENDIRKVISEVNNYSSNAIKELTQNYRIKTKSGEIRWIENRTWIRKNKNNEITHYQGIVIDVTQRNKAEQMLMESEGRYRTLAENSYDLICEVSSDSKFIYTSPNFFEVLGYTRKELTGKSIFDLVHIDDLPIVLTELRKDFGKATFRCKHKDGEWKWFESAGKRFRTASGSINGVIVSRDITERKQFEMQLIHTEKLMAVGEMAAMIAHEFRNALTSIKMILQLQIESPNLNKNEVKSFNVAINSIYHMEKVVQQLLNFAHPAPMEMHIEDLNSILSECLPFIQMECRKKSINFIKKFDTSLPPLLIHSPSIKEAVINLLLNATQAFKVNNKLRRRISLFTKKIVINETLRDLDFGVQTTRLKVRKKPSNKKEIVLKSGTECVLIEISDNGSGIEESSFPRIFEPFFTTKEKGSGLGLPIVKRTINAHNGIIVVKSTKSVGTTFKIYLPVKFGNNS